MRELSGSDHIPADMVPVYQKHLSKSDVEEMIKFYSTPTGQKILREMPAMTAEAYAEPCSPDRGRQDGPDQPRGSIQMSRRMKDEEQTADPTSNRP